MSGIQRKPDSLFQADIRLGTETFSTARATFDFTLDDGSTCGFPGSWLYRYDYRQGEKIDGIVLQFAEHRVTVHGHPLKQLLHCLREGTTFQLQETPKRYLEIKREEKAFIESIVIEPLNRPETQPTDSPTASYSQQPKHPPS